MPEMTREQAINLVKSHFSQKYYGSTVADLILRVDREARLETAREIAATLRYDDRDDIRSAYPAAFTEEPHA